MEINAGLLSRRWNILLAGFEDVNKGISSFGM
jgi:hypothetical protein